MKVPSILKKLRDRQLERRTRLNVKKLIIHNLLEPRDYRLSHLRGAIKTGFGHELSSNHQLADFFKQVGLLPGVLRKKPYYFRTEELLEAGFSEKEIGVHELYKSK